MFSRSNNRNLRPTNFSYFNLSVFIAILFLIYQYFFIQSIITWTGMCLSTFWMAGDNPLSTLYSLFFFIVSLLIVGTIGVIVWKYYKYKKLTLNQKVFFTVCLIALSAWMYHLVVMMLYFEWEHQLIAFESLEKILFFDPIAFLQGEEISGNRIWLYDPFGPKPPSPGPGCLTSEDEILTMKEWIERNY